MSSDDHAYAADEEAPRESEERIVEIEITEERTARLEKDKEKLLNENRQLRDQVCAYERRLRVFGGNGDDSNDTRREFAWLAIQESNNVVENLRVKQNEIDSLKANNKILKDEIENLIKKLEHYEKLNVRGRKKAIYLLAENKMLRRTVDRLNERSIEVDYKDGANKAEGKEIPRLERPTELAGFRNCYYCPVSCVSSVVSFVFFAMGLPVCIRRFEREVQNTLNLLSKECEEEFEVGNCSLAFRDFRDVFIIQKESKISEVITDVDKIGHHLEKATATMKGEQHPALFIMHYKSDTGRAGHCLAIMPDLKFIDVQEGYYWYPEKDPHWKNVSMIEVWKVEEHVAEEFEGKCSLKNCGKECKTRMPNHSETANELS